MRHVVKLCHDVVPVFGTSEAVLIKDLGAKVAKNDDGGLVRSVEQRTNEKLEVFQALLVTTHVRL